MLYILSHYRSKIYGVIQEEQFAQEFLAHDGLNELVDVIFKSTGNTLAVRIIMDYPSYFPILKGRP
jgi:hypothetical protein